MSLKFALLGFLNYQPRSGYDLKQVMDVSTSNFWQAKQSQIYATLKKLEKEGLIHSHIQTQEYHPNKRIYEITEAGQADLREWLAQPQMTLKPNKEPLLLKLFFSAQINPQEILAELHVQRNLHQAELQKYQTTTKDVIRQFGASTDMADDARLWEATRRYGELYEEMYIHWLDETIAVVEKGKA